jgi:hypothetical protein
MEEEVEIAPGIKYTRTQLGEAVFLKDGAQWANHDTSIRPSNWSISELRSMADFMEANPNCTLFNDGSGKPVRK